MPKLSEMDLAWPTWRKPLGSGGKRVTTWPPCVPRATSSATTARMKSRGLSISVGIAAIHHGGHGEHGEKHEPEVQDFKYPLASVWRTRRSATYSSGFH